MEKHIKYWLRRPFKIETDYLNRNKGQTQGDVCSLSKRYEKIWNSSLFNNFSNHLMRHFSITLSFPLDFPYTFMQSCVNQKESVSKDAEIFNYSFKKCFLPSRRTSASWFNHNWKFLFKNEEKGIQQDDLNLGQTVILQISLFSLSLFLCSRMTAFN